MIDATHAATIGRITEGVNGFLTGRTQLLRRSYYRPMLADVLSRIERRLQVTGLSATAASRQAGLTEDAIRNLRRAAKEGTRQGVSTRTIAALAPVLGTTSGWLLEAAGDEEVEGQQRRTVPLVGYVGAGAEAHFYAEAQGPFEEIDAPEGATETTVAVEVRGDSLGALFDRWLVLYDDVRRPVTYDLIGKLCVVGLPDERVLVKKLQRSRDAGFFHLLSNTEAPILDTLVTWAARVKQMMPR